MKIVDEAKLRDCPFSWFICLENLQDKLYNWWSLYLADRCRFLEKFHEPNTSQKQIHAAPGSKMKFPWRRVRHDFLHISCNTCLDCVVSPYTKFADSSNKMSTMIRWTEQCKNNYHSQLWCSLNKLSMNGGAFFTKWYHILWIFGYRVSYMELWDMQIRNSIERAKLYHIVSAILFNLTPLLTFLKTQQFRFS